MHCWSVSERIQQISREVLQVNQGSLYPTLHRQARFYSLTAQGRIQLELEAENWARLSDAIGRVLKLA